MRDRASLGAVIALTALVASTIRPASADELSVTTGDAVAPSQVPESTPTPGASSAPADASVGGSPIPDKAPAPDNAPTPDEAPVVLREPAQTDVRLNVSLREATAIGYVVSPGEKESTEILLPSGELELGGELVFVTADGLPPARGASATADTQKIALTDLAFLRLRARRSFGKSLELFATSELLAKQPTRLDEPVWLGSSAGLRTPFAKHFAFQLAGALGPTLHRSGLWWQAEPRFLFKASAGHALRFALDLGNTLTELELNDTSPKPTWLDELAIGAEAQFGDHSGAFWIRTDYYVPLASSGLMNGPSPLYSGNLDPQVRINLQLGGVLTISEHGWDAYAEYSWIDRGELGKPLTTLPILDGGFDQQQITLGVVHRFETERPRALAE